MTALDPGQPLYFQTATALRNALARREISASELLDETLARYKAVNEPINAIIVTDIDAAKAAAKAADEALAKGTAGPLAGLPMTIKDVYEVVGMPATCGFPELADHYPERDADPVANLRAAGAVIWGKSNVPTGACDHQSVNPIYGLTRNPWNPDYSPGGSSGGAAAAVAAGMTSLELGTDIGGSIRVPAHFSGVYGLKPSFGVVSQRGNIPPMPGALGRTPLGVFGPLARSAFDLEWMFDVIVGPNERERKAFSIHLPPSRQERLGDFRIGVWLDAYPLDDGYRAAIETLLGQIEKAGGKVDRKAHPDIDPANQYETYMTILEAVEGAGASEAAYKAQVDAGLAAEPGSYAELIGSRMSQNVRSLGAAQMRQEELIKRWDAYFRDYDLLICPIFPRTAFPHALTGDGHMAQYDRTIIVNNQPIPYLDGLMWPGMATLPEVPAVAVPTGELVDGLPTAVQIIGPYLEDRTPLRFAQLLETAIGSGFRIPPAYR